MLVQTVNIGCLEEAPGIHGRREMEAVPRVDRVGRRVVHGMIIAVSVFLMSNPSLPAELCRWLKAGRCRSVVRSKFQMTLGKMVGRSVLDRPRISRPPTSFRKPSLNLRYSYFDNIEFKMQICLLNVTLHL